MADSDGEDERFVKNVIHELSAFQPADKSPGSDPGDSKSTDTVDPVTPADQCDKPGQDEADPPKPPPRVIRLSRPLNPYGSTRTSASSSSSSTPDSTRRSLDSGLNSNDDGSVSSPRRVLPGTGGSSSGSSTPGISSSPAPGTAPTTGPGAPGSRLAALQRPGSPMHKFLQRSKSPALVAAAARLGGQQSSSDTAITSTSNKESVTSSSGSDPSIGNKDTAESESSSQSTSLRSTIPPRIQSTGLTSSILLRRPQSPLRTSRTALLTKQTSDPSDDGQASPKSPPSESVGNSSTASSEDAQAAEKEAIRNKLRANSFRLKGLLSGRVPFGRSKDEGEAKDGNSTDQSAESSDGQGGSVDEGSGSRDRTRWRAEGSTGGYRSRLSERTQSFLAARARNRNTQGSQDTPDDKSNTTADTDNDTGTSVSDSRRIRNASNDLAQTNSQENCNNENQNSENIDQDRVSNQEPLPVGATLLRSPRTRAVSLDPSVPSSEENVHDQTEAINNDSTSAKHDKTLSDKRSKTLSDLERDADVNLVFDSVNIGQQAENSSHDIQPSDMSKSMYSASPSQSRRTRRGQASSEPATPITERPLPNSQSFEKSAEADFLHSSPQLKRSFAVTDLDKAMWERDKQKLDSISKRVSQDQGEDSQEPEEPAEREKPQGRYVPSTSYRCLLIHLQNKHSRPI